MKVLASNQRQLVVQHFPREELFYGVLIVGMSFLLGLSMADSITRGPVALIILGVFLPGAAYLLSLEQMTLTVDSTAGQVAIRRRGFGRDRTSRYTFAEFSSIMLHERCYKRRMYYQIQLVQPHNRPVIAMKCTGGKTKIKAIAQHISQLAGLPLSA